MAVAGVPVDAGALLGALEREDSEPMTLLRLDPDRALAAGTPFDPLIEVWLGRRRGSAVPDWDDFEFSDFRGWHSELIISVFPDADPDPEFRIVGETWRALRDGDGTGMRFSQMLPRLYALQFRDHFAAIRDGNLIGWAAGRSPHARTSYLRFQAIELPFRRGGPAVAGLIHGFHLDH